MKMNLFVRKPERFLFEVVDQLEKENAKLKAQIEKMKCCGNCSNSSDSKITVCDKWELAE